MVGYSSSRVAMVQGLRGSEMVGQTRLPRSTGRRTRSALCSSHGWTRLLLRDASRRRANWRSKQRLRRQKSSSPPRKGQSKGRTFCAPSKANQMAQRPQNVDENPHLTRVFCVPNGGYSRASAFRPFPTRMSNGGAFRPRMDDLMQTESVIFALFGRYLAICR